MLSLLPPLCFIRPHGPFFLPPSNLSPSSLSRSAFYAGEAVKQIDVPSMSGAFGILPSHVPTMAALAPGVVCFWRLGLITMLMIFYNAFLGLYISLLSFLLGVCDGSRWCHLQILRVEWHGDRSRRFFGPAPRRRSLSHLRH